MAENMTKSDEQQQQQLTMSQRLRFIHFPRQQPLPDKSDLYWPCLSYQNMGEGAALDFHHGFQQRIGMDILNADIDGIETENPICRLLGFEDGTYASLAPSECGQNLLTFVPNLGKHLVTEKNKDQFFDLQLEEEQQLYTLYQDAVKEARVVMRQSRVVAPGGGLNIQIRKKQKQEHHDSNENGGGGGGNDKPDDDSSNAFAARMEAARPALPAAVPARQPLRVARQNNHHEVVEQNLQVQEVAVAQAQEVVAAAAAVTEEPEPTKDEQDPKPPGTPPFHRASDIESNEPWANVWNKMRYAGWNRRTNRDVEDDYIFTKPDKNTYDGKEGIDYFTSTRKVQRYVQSKIPHWQPPAPIVDDEGSFAAPQPLVEDDEEEEEVEERRISSAATVVTAGSLSPQVTKKSTGRARRCSRPASSKSSFGPDKLWWQGMDGKRKETYTIPTLADVRDILIKLGIRRDSEGVFHLPENIGDNVETPELPDVDSLCNYLCSKGIPQVKNMELIDKSEQELLHKWVSFAYVPLEKLDGKLTKVSLPSNDKMVALLSKFRFEKCDETYFPPKVDHCGVKRDLRIPGVHFFRGLPELRDYIRRSASFAWTADELEVKEGDVSGDPNEEFLIRLWAASSPTPLLTYETSEEEIQHMDKTFAEVGFAVESDSEEEEATDEESSVDSSSEAEQSCDSPTPSSTSPEDNTHDYESEEEENIEQETPPPVARRTMKAAGKRVREPEESKRRVRRQNNTDDKKFSNQKPWWKKESVPSFDTMRPILKKLGIVQDKQDGVFILPGKGKEDNLRDPERLRKCLCSGGIPKFKSSYAKPCLSENQRELLRRWVSFANVPIDSDDSPEELEKVSSLLDKHFSRENHIIPFIGRFGFQRNSEGEGYFPPGIDQLGRDRKVRKEHLKNDLAQVREYIRCSEKLKLSRPKTQDDYENSDYTSDEESNHQSDSNLLALRLWAALEPTPLRSYEVGSSAPTTGKLGKKVSGAPSPDPVKLNKKKRTIATSDVLNIVALPDWWTARNEDCLKNIIRDLQEKEKKSSGKRRGPSPHMTWQQLQLACAVRSKMEAAIITSPRKGKQRVTIDDQIFDLAEEWNIADSRLKAFLSGDEKMLVRKEVLREIENFFRKWLGQDHIEGEVNGEADDTIKVSKHGDAEKGKSKDTVNSKSNKEASEGKHENLRGPVGQQKDGMIVEENATQSEEAISAAKLPETSTTQADSALKPFQKSEDTIEIKKSEATDDATKDISSPTAKSQTTGEVCMVVDASTEDSSGVLEPPREASSNVVIGPSAAAIDVAPSTMPTDERMVDVASTGASSGGLDPSSEKRCSTTVCLQVDKSKTNTNQKQQGALEIADSSALIPKEEISTNKTEDASAVVPWCLKGEEAQPMDVDIKAGTEVTSTSVKNVDGTKDGDLPSQDDHLVTEPAKKDAEEELGTNDAKRPTEVSFMTDKIELRDDELCEAEPDRTDVFGKYSPIKSRGQIKLAPESPEQTSSSVTDYADDTSYDFLTQPELK